MRLVFSILSLSLFICNNLSAMEQQAQIYVRPTFTVALQSSAENGNAQAQFELSCCYKEGWGVDKAPQSAHFWLQKSAEKGYADAQYQWAWIIERDARSMDQALAWYKKAAEQGELLSQLKLAKYYDTKGVHFLPHEAVELYQKIVSNDLIRTDVGDDVKKSVNDARAEAAFALAEKYRQGKDVAQSYERAAEYYQQALIINPNNEKAAYYLGLFHMQGSGVPQNVAAARLFFLRALERGHVQARCQLGNIARTSGDLDKAVKWYRDADLLGDAEAPYNLAMFYEKDARQYGEAIAHYLKAIKRLYKPALDRFIEIAQAKGDLACLVGQLFEVGQGVVKNEYTACQWYKKALALGYLQALENLEQLAAKSREALYIYGEMYLSGPVKNEARALELLSRAARAGHQSALERLKELAASSEVAAKANTILGLMFFKAEGVGKDIGQGCQAFIRAADLNDPEGQYYMGRCYEEGAGIPANAMRTLDYYTKAAEQSSRLALDRLMKLAESDAEAAYSIGRLYEVGKGVEKSKENAELWYRKAAEKGSHMALRYLGDLCENRSTRTYITARQYIANYEEALAWYSKAAEHNCFGAVDAGERVQAILDCLARLREPNFRNPLFVRFSSSLRDEMPPDLMYWIAYLCNQATSHCPPVLQEMLLTTLQDVPWFGKQSTYVRAIVRVLAHLAESENFNNATLGAREDGFGTDFGRICRGINLINHAQKTVQKLGERSYKRADVRGGIDMRIEALNCFFRVAEKPCDDATYLTAVNSIVAMIERAVLEKRITQTMLQPAGSRDMGTRDTLLAFLTYYKSERFRNLIVHVSRLLHHLDEKTRAKVLASWAVAGHHCEKFVDEETYAFFIFALTSARVLDEEFAGLAVRMALCLAQLRRNLLKSLVPVDAANRPQQIAYLDKKAGRLLSLVGDTETVRDGFSAQTVDAKYSSVTPESIRDEALKLYTTDAMTNCVVQEAHKADGSTLCYKHIVKYLEALFQAEELN